LIKKELFTYKWDVGQDFPEELADFNKTPPKEKIKNPVIQ